MPNNKQFVPWYYIYVARYNNNYNIIYIISYLLSLVSFICTSTNFLIYICSLIITHACAAYITSHTELFCPGECCQPSVNCHVQRFGFTSRRQRLDDHSFGLIIAAATDADKARLLSTSVPHAAASYPLTQVRGWVLLLKPQSERRKHTANDPKCAELGWVCVPLAVETYCYWYQ